MTFEEPTYEEYKKATAFARFKYKYGIVVMILSWLLFLFVIVYMVINGEAVASNPIDYAAEKYDLSCSCLLGGKYQIYFDKDYISSSPLNKNGNLQEIDLDYLNITN